MARPRRPSQKAIDNFHYDLGAYDELKVAGLTSVQQVFEHPLLNVWRNLDDRDNATLDFEIAPNEWRRYHIKRDKRKRGEPVADEVHGIELPGDGGCDLCAMWTREVEAMGDVRTLWTRPGSRRGGARQERGVPGVRGAR